MFPAGLPVKEQLGQLEAALGFDWDDQDWGIVNAQGDRVAEFIDFFEQHYDEHWSVYTVAEYVDLVLESACQAIGEDPRFSPESVDSFVRKVAPLAPEQIAYWTSHEWAITPHLRQLGV
jgi:hypothetical protein